MKISANVQTRHINPENFMQTDQKLLASSCLARPRLQDL